MPASGSSAFPPAVGVACRRGSRRPAPSRSVVAFRARPAPSTAEAGLESACAARVPVRARRGGRLGSWRSSASCTMRPTSCPTVMRGSTCDSNPRRCSSPCWQSASVGSGAGAPTVGSGGSSNRFRVGPQSGSHGHVSSPRHLKRSMRVSRTTLPCLLRVKSYGADPVGSAFAAAGGHRTR